MKWYLLKTVHSNALFAHSLDPRAATHAQHAEYCILHMTEGKLSGVCAVNKMESLTQSWP